MERGGAMLRLYNTSDSTVTAYGTSGSPANVTNDAKQWIDDYFTLAASKTLEFQLYTTSANIWGTHGPAAGIASVNEQYSNFTFEKV